MYFSDINENNENVKNNFDAYNVVSKLIPRLKF